jgi:hypothetical protein
MEWWLSHHRATQQREIIMAHDIEQTEEQTDDSATGLTDALSESEVEFVTDEVKSKGAGSMLLFGLVLAAGAATYFMYWKTGPSSATAATVEAKEATTTIKQFLSDGHVSLRAMEEMRKNTERVVKRFQDHPSMTQVPLSALKSNPFRLTPAVPDAEISEAAAKRRREQEREAAVKAVQGLALQSVIVSDRPACMINKTLYTEGQQVDIFVIEKISKGAVIVKSNGFRFELKMTR